MRIRRRSALLVFSPPIQTPDLSTSREETQHKNPRHEKDKEDERGRAEEFPQVGNLKLEANKPFPACNPQVLINCNVSNLKESHSQHPISANGSKSSGAVPQVGNNGASSSLLKAKATNHSAQSESNDSNGSNGEKEQGKKWRNTAVLMEGSRCSRVNGRGWRCSQLTLVGYSLCEHHLGKGRLRNISTVKAHLGSGSLLSKHDFVGGGAVGVGKKEKGKVRKKIGVVKAKSISSLLHGNNAL